MVKVIGRYSCLLLDGQKWNLRLLKCYLPPAATWTEPLGQPSPDVTVELGTEVVCNGEEQTVGEEEHHYPARGRPLPDRYVPEDFRQKKPRPEKGKSQGPH